MSNSISAVKCNKTLFMDGDSVPSFVKGKVYDTCNMYPQASVNEFTFVTDEIKEAHKLGNWSKHFKSV